MRIFFFNIHRLDLLSSFDTIGEHCFKDVNLFFNFFRARTVSGVPSRFRIDISNVANIWVFYTVVKWGIFGEKVGQKCRF